MAELLKNSFNIKFIGKLSRAIIEVYPQFDQQRFADFEFDASWQQKELKQRMHHISDRLQQFLCRDYKQAIQTLMPVASQFGGFEYMVFPDFVERFGLDDREISMHALAHFTQYSSSEFAIRAFILRYPQPTMVQMERWAETHNPHLRRLASEGCRPRLPWAVALPDFKKDPTPVLNILQK